MGRGGGSRDRPRAVPVTDRFEYRENRPKNTRMTLDAELNLHEKTPGILGGYLLMRISTKNVKIIECFELRILDCIF
jgi:hypothetical protein